MKYVLVDQSDNVLRVAFFDSSPPPFNQKPWRWVPVTVINSVVVDNNTEVRLASTYVISGDSATEDEQKRSMTTEELDARKDASVERAFSPESIALSTVCFQLTNAVRNLNSQGAITVNQFRTYLKSLL